MSCTRTEDICDTPNSTVSPARNSSTATVLSVSSNDAPAGGVAAAEEEEDGIATYRRRRAGGLLHTGQISDEQEQGGKTSSERFKKAVRVFAERRKIKFKTRRPPPPFIHRARRFGRPAIQQYRVNQRSCQKPPRDHFERGQCLHHLATSSAPDDSVELVPRRANVGAKVKTPPFARCLRRPRWIDGDKTTDRLTLRSTRRRTKTYDEVIPSRDLVLHGGPRVIRPIVTGPAWSLRVTGLLCKASL
jgi:hypothetical protein